MIIDQLSQWHRYTKLGARFEQACRYLETVNAQTPQGRYELDGTNLFALVQAYPTKLVEQCRFEAHRQYTDIQFIVTGREKILWAPLAALTTMTQPYNAEKDVVFFAAPTVATPLHMEAGQFAVFFPEDGHAPGVESAGVADVLKVVMKVRL